ncbi:MAG: FHA domain-containing protein [Anaerolineales bacterium]|nr:FHA domain-containing protein [Anaerolineales bacterium]
MPDQVRTKPLKAAKLVWREDKNTLKEYVVYEGFTTLIGREKSNHIVLMNPIVSKRHAQIHWQDNAFMITDLDSSNGTFVDGAPIYMPTQLADDCRINIGEYVLSFHELDEPIFALPESPPKGETRTLFIEDESGDEDTLQDIPWSMEMLAEDRPPPETFIEASNRFTDSREPPWMPSDQKTEPRSVEAPSRITDIPRQAPIPEQGSYFEFQQAEIPPTEATPEIIEAVGERPAPTQQAPSRPRLSQDRPAPTAPQEYQMEAEIPASSQAAYAELLRSIQTAHSMGQSLRDRWLAVLNSIQTSIAQIGAISQEMEALKRQVSEAKLDELFNKLSSNPNNVRVLVELADYSALMEEILTDYLSQANKIEEVKDDLESILKN